MAGQMQGKTMLVTGGSDGIGLSCALAFVNEGAKVVITGRRAEAGEKAVRMLKDAGGEAIYLQSDVSRAVDCQAMVEKTVEAFGRLDFAFNNAGVGPVYATVQDYTEEDWDRIININLKGVWLSMKYEIPQMLKQGKGVIVNMASAVSFVGLERRGAYVAAKHGVMGITKVAAVENATKGIRVNAICPGYTRTPMNERTWARDPSTHEMHRTISPMMRIAEPEEITGATVFLFSDATSFMTGQALVLDGGWTAR